MSVADELCELENTKRADQGLGTNTGSEVTPSSRSSSQGQGAEWGMCCGEDSLPSMPLSPQGRAESWFFPGVSRGSVWVGEKHPTRMGLLSDFPTAPEEPGLGRPAGASEEPETPEERSALQRGTDWHGRKGQGLLCSRAIPNSTSSSCYTMKNFLKGTGALGLCHGKPGPEAVRERSFLGTLETWLGLFAEVQLGPAVDRRFSPLCPARAGQCFAPPAQANEGITVLGVHPAEHIGVPALSPARGQRGGPVSCSFSRQYLTHKV